MKTLALVLLYFLCLTVTAEHLKETKPERLKIKKGATISVTKWYPANNAFLVELPKEPAVGPNYATPDDLQSAIGMEGTVTEFIKQMQRDPSAIYALKEPLMLLEENEFKLRATKRKR